MKKFFRLICVIFALLLLAGCGKEKYELSCSVDDVERIEFFYLPHPWDRSTESLQAIEPIMVIEESEHSTFLNEFLGMPCIRQSMDHMEGIAYNTIKITYKTGSAEWICHFDSLYYNIESEQIKWKHYYFEEEIFNTFISKYCQIIQHAPPAKG